MVTMEAYGWVVGTGLQPQRSRLGLLNRMSRSYCQKGLRFGKHTNNKTPEKYTGVFGDLSKWKSSCQQALNEHFFALAQAGFSYLVDILAIKGTRATGVTPGMGPG